MKRSWWWLLVGAFAWLTLMTGLALVVNREFFVNDLVFVLVWIGFALLLVATRTVTPRHR